jgi:hypothetical protein
MTTETIKALAEGLYRLVRPLVSIMIRNGFPYSAFADVCKRAYVDVAKEQYPLPKRKQSAARISLLTGLPRKEVATLLDRPRHESVDVWESQNRTARIVLGWANDREFCDRANNPLVLPVEIENEKKPSFTRLVKKFSGDVTVRASLDELIRIGVAEMVDDSHIRLRSKNYLPETGEAEKLWILGIAGADLYSTIDHNLQFPEQGFIQRYHYYDNIPKEALDLIREKARQQSVAFLAQIDAWLSAYDRDNNPTVHGSGRFRAGVGLYYFENPVNTDLDKG